MARRNRLDATVSVHHVFEFNRARMVIGLIKTHGVALAEFPGWLDVSKSAISKIIKRKS